MDKAPSLDTLTREQLLALIQERSDGGVKLEFSGKSNARRLARLVRPRVQRSIAKFSVGGPEEQAQNLLIEGDNLQSMVTLYKERGRVDLIITDPPYNTGKDFRYNDKWDEDPNDPDMGELVSEEDAARHTKWMRFMLPRLKMMRSMLKPTGVLAICIDQRELFHLGQMLDELFDDRNRLAIINWERSSTLRNDKSGVSTATEYVLVYAKDRTKVRTNMLSRTEKHNAGYRNPDSDPGGDWDGVTPFAPGRATHQGMYYAVQSPFTGQLHYPSGNQCWKDEKRALKRALELWGTPYTEVDLGDGHAKALLLAGARSPLELADGEIDPVVQAARSRALNVQETQVLPSIFFTTQGEGRPRKKAYLNQIKKGIIASTYWADEDYTDAIDIGCTSWDSAESGTSEVGSRELRAILGDDHGFETVKPVKLFQKIIHLWCPPDGLVVDPFAGSGTTGHAIFAQNATLGTDRRFILIEQGRPEKGDSYARTLTVERLRRVVTGKWNNGKGEPLGGGYRFVALGTKVDADALLKMERVDMVDAILASYYDTSRRRGSGLVTVPPDEYKYLVAHNGDREGFFLVWDGPNMNTDFTEEVFEACSAEAARAELKATYHVYARYNLYQTENVNFLKIPDRILIDFGLDLRQDVYTEGDGSRD